MGKLKNQMVMEKLRNKVLETLKTKYNWDVDSFVTDDEHLQFINDVILSAHEAIGVAMESAHKELIERKVL